MHNDTARNRKLIVITYSQFRNKLPQQKKILSTIRLSTLFLPLVGNVLPLCPIGAVNLIYQPSNMHRLKNRRSLCSVYTIYILVKYRQAQRCRRHGRQNAAAEAW